MQERWLLLGEMAAPWGVNPDPICNWITPNNLPAPTPGRLWPSLASGVDTWLKAGQAAR